MFLKIISLFFILLFVIIVFLLNSYLVMLCYNNSIVKMNTNWKKIDYKTSMIFTLLFVLLFGFANPLEIKLVKL